MRSTPYTAAGIGRVPCARCGEPAAYQWSVCALGNGWVPVCRDCDVGLNALILVWLKWASWRRLIRKYRRKVFARAA